MILADTGFFLALANSRDELHARAATWVLQVREPVLVMQYVLVESVNALAEGRLRRKADSLLEAVGPSRRYVYVPVTAELHQRGVELFVSRPDKGWSLTDCVSFLVMHERGIARALAHDHHFEQAGFVALLRQEPPRA